MKGNLKTLSCVKLSSMKRIAAVMLLMCSFTTYAQQQVQYFDGADTSATNSILIQVDTSAGNIWQVGPPQKTIFDSAATSPNVMVTDTINWTPQNNTSRFTFSTIVPTSFGIWAMQWKQKLDMDKHHSGGVLEFSKDSGQTWYNAFNNPAVYNFFGFDTLSKDTLWNNQYAFSGTDTNWRDIWCCVHASFLGSTFPMALYWRFTFQSDSSATSKEGWMIDNMNAHFTWAHPVKDITMKDYVQVYPNPVSDIAHIDIANVQGYHIIEKMMLYDENGLVVDKWENIPTRYWFETKKYLNGHYTLKIKTNVKTKSIPLVIQH